MKGAVPPMWICDECISSRFNQVVNNEAPNDQAAASSRSTYQVVDSEVVHDQNMTSGDSGNQISATHDQLSQAHASPVGNEKPIFSA